MDILKAIWNFLDGKKRNIAVVLNMVLAAVLQDNLLVGNPILLKWIVIGVETFSGLALGHAAAKSYIGTGGGDAQ